MLFLPVSYVFEDLLGLNIHPFLAETTGVCEKTWKNQREGRHNFKPGTFNKICNNTNALARENNPHYVADVRETFEEIFKSDPVFGWSSLLDAFNAGNYPNVLFPDTQKLIRNFESYSASFVTKYKAEGHKSAIRHLLSLKLPDGFIGEKDISFIKRTDSIESVSKLLVLISMRSLLYLAASIDAEMIIQTENDPSMDSKFKKFLPIESGYSVLLPIPRFLVWIQSTLKFKNQNTIINFINDKVAEENSKAPSVRKQWGKWKNGKIIPRWSKLDQITGYFFPDYDSWERRFSVAFIVLFQQLYEIFNYMIASNIYEGSERDILDEFDHYARWFGNLATENRTKESKGQLPN